MSRRGLLSSSVTIGALSALSTILLASCATEPWADQGSFSYGPSNSSVGVEDSRPAKKVNGLLARCVSRASEQNGSYLVVPDAYCDRSGKHHAYLWYYGGKRVKKLVSHGSTVRPRHRVVFTTTGDKIARDGGILATLAMDRPANAKPKPARPKSSESADFDDSSDDDFDDSSDEDAYISDGDSDSDSGGSSYSSSDSDSGSGYSTGGFGNRSSVGS